MPAVKERMSAARPDRPQAANVLSSKGGLTVPSFARQCWSSSGEGRLCRIKLLELQLTGCAL